VTEEEKLAFHLEMVVWQDLPKGTYLSDAELAPLVAAATDDQKRRAYERGLVRSPLLAEAIDRIGATANCVGDDKESRNR
jgi:hypothetical protein